MDTNSPVMWLVLTHPHIMVSPIHRTVVMFPQKYANLIPLKKNSDGNHRGLCCQEATKRGSRGPQSQEVHNERWHKSTAKPLGSRNGRARHRRDSPVKPSKGSRRVNPTVDTKCLYTSYTTYKQLAKMIQTG